MSSVQIRTFSIRQDTNKEASETWGYWKAKNSGGISDKICKLMIEAWKKEIQAEQSGGLTPNELFLKEADFLPSKADEFFYRSFCLLYSHNIEIPNLL